jgi:hypothetical protein
MFFAMKPSSLFCLLHRLVNNYFRSCSPLFLLESHEDIVREQSPDASCCAFWVPGPVAFLTHSIAHSPNAAAAHLAARTVACGSVVQKCCPDGWFGRERSHSCTRPTRHKAFQRSSHTQAMLLLSSSVPALPSSSSATTSPIVSNLAKQCEISSSTIRHMCSFSSFLSALCPSFILRGRALC